MATGELIVAPRGGDVVASDFLPVLTVQQSLDRKEQMNLFISKVMREGEDYGVIPGSKKPTLYKAGAEKLCSLFGLTPQYTADTIIEDWTGEEHGGEPMFYYAYRCSLSRGGRFMGEAIGSCSSWESKYRHRWVREDQLQLPQDADKSFIPSKGGKQTLFAYDFAIEKAETDGQYGKPAEYWERFKAAIADGSAKKINKPFKSGKDGWGYEITVDSKLYRIPNPDVADTVNTIQKMAQKRALVDAVKVVTNASDAFTQDLEDFVEPTYAATVARQEGSGTISSGGELFDNDDDPGPSPQPPPPVQQRAPQSAHEKQREAVAAQFQASQAVADAHKEALRPAILDGRPIPEDLSVLFARIDKQERDAVVQAWHLMDQSFKALNLAAAHDEHEDIKVKYRNQFPSGGRKKATGLDIKICLLDMWDSLKRWEKWKEDNRGPI